MLNFYVNGQLLSKIDNGVVVSHAVNYPIAHFMFSGEEWEHITKYALFRRADGTTSYKVKLVNDECTVPGEVLSQGAGELIISVYGGERITTTSVVIRILNGSYVKGQYPVEPIFNETATVQEVLDYVED